MKVAEMIASIDQLRQNQYDTEQKTRWLSEVEGMIIDEVINMAEGNEREFSEYRYETDADVSLVLPARFCDIYEHYVKAKIEFYDEEMNQYNNEVAAYQAAYQQFAAWYRRTHMPKQPAKFII